MKTKILVAEIPFGESVESVLDSILRDTIVDTPRGFSSRVTRTAFTPNRQSRVDHRPLNDALVDEFSVSREVRFGQPLPAWGVAGKPADNNKVFGAGFHIDEPRIENYAFGDEWKFESDKEAFDRFVDAGEDCVARGLARPDGVTEHRVQAIRKRIQDGPAFPHETGGNELIGESHIWR